MTGVYYFLTFVIDDGILTVLAFLIDEGYRLLKDIEAEIK